MAAQWPIDLENADIEIVRKAFQDKYADNIKKDAYDERDLKILREDDTYVKNFVWSKEELKEAAEVIHECLKWRKETAIRDLTRESISKKLLDLDAIYFQNSAKDSSKILWIEIKKYKKDLLADSKLLIGWLVESYVTEHPEGKLVVIMDMSKSGLSNYDMEFIRFTVYCFSCYYPAVLSHLLFYDAPWLFNAMWTVVKSFLDPAELEFIKFVKKSTVQEYVDKDNLFEHMGGTSIRGNSLEKADGEGSEKK